MDIRSCQLNPSDSAHNSAKYCVMLWELVEPYSYASDIVSTIERTRLSVIIKYLSSKKRFHQNVYWSLLYFRAITPDFINSRSMNCMRFQYFWTWISWPKAMKHATAYPPTGALLILQWQPGTRFFRPTQWLKANFFLTPLKTKSIWHHGKYSTLCLLLQHFR